MRGLFRKQQPVAPPTPLQGCHYCGAGIPFGKGHVVVLHNDPQPGRVLVAYACETHKDLNTK